MSIEKISEQDKKTIDAQVLRIKQDSLITKKLTSQLDGATAAPDDLIAKKNDLQLNISSNSKTDVKGITSIQLKKAQLNEKIDLVNERLGLASSFMQKFVKFMKDKKADTQQLEEFMNQMSDVKQIAERELTHDKNKGGAGKADEIGDLRFAGVLKNMYAEPNKAHAQKSFLERAQFESEGNKAFKLLNEDKMTKKTAENEMEDKKIKKVIVEKQAEDSRQIKIADKALKKHDAEVVKPEIKYAQEKEKMVAQEEMIERNREKLLKVLPFLDEKKRFFEYILGDKLEQFKSKLKKDEGSQKFIIEREERDKAKFENYLEKKIQQKNDRFHNNQPLMAQNQGFELSVGEDKNRIKNNKISLIISELSSDEKNINELDNEMKKQYQAISRMMDSISDSNVDENEISNLDKTAEKTLQQIEQLRKKLELHKQELPDDKKIEDEMMDASKPQPNIDINRAIHLVQQLTTPTQIDKVYGVQKKMTPWVVQQLIF